MTSKNMKTASLEEIRKMKNRNELHSSTEAIIQDDELSSDFWENAEVIEPAGKKSVHLKLDLEVFEFFKQGGKGHLTRMQSVLAAYVKTKSHT